MITLHDEDLSHRGSWMYVPRNRGLYEEEGSWSGITVFVIGIEYWIGAQEKHGLKIKI